MSPATFIANFFRQGTNESSTRLVGVFGFIAGTVLAFVVVVTGKASLDTAAVIALIYAQSMIALGLRKSPDAEGGAVPPATTGDKG